MNRKYAARILGIIWVLSILSTLFIPHQWVRAQPNPLITFIFPTATRTPTPINVGNFVWDDLDRDGVQDAGEPGLANITVQLWNGAKNQLIDQTVSNGNGNYTLIAPTPGDYRVRAVLADLGDYFTLQNAASTTDQLDSDINPTGGDYGFTAVYTFASNLISITTIDIGIVKYREPTATRTPTPIHLGNFVWHDLNSNGIQDAGEPGVGGVTLQLWNAAKTDLLSSTSTLANGSYSLIAPIPGDYRIRVLLPAGASFSPVNQGGDDTKDSDIEGASNFGFTAVISIASNVISISSLDAGLINVLPSATPSITSTPSPSSTPMPPTTYYLYLPLASN